MRRVLLLLLGTLVPLLAGCNAYGPHVQTLRGNYAFSSGDYQPAIVDYLRAQEDGLFEGWIAFNLGNVYYFLGESQAALDRWDAARDTGDRDIMFRSAFNHGVFFFEQGRYREAFRQFRYALELSPGDASARHNMEMTVIRLLADSDLSQRSEERLHESNQQSPSDRSPGDSTLDQGTANRMLDYMRRREEQRWRANVEQAPDAEVEDW